MNFLEVRLPRATTLIVGVGDIVADPTALAANFTSSCHVLKLRAKEMKTSYITRHSAAFNSKRWDRLPDGRRVFSDSFPL